MRVVIATQELINPAGTETYVCLVARELQRLGHEAVLTAERFGPMADHAESQAIVVARTAAELPAQRHGVRRDARRALPGCAARARRALRRLRPPGAGARARRRRRRRRLL
jgi:hypothetical protein